MASIYKKIESVISRLSDYQEKFRGFSNFDPESIFISVSKSIPEFKTPSAAKYSLYKLYADYIGHYMNKLT